MLVKVDYTGKNPSVFKCDRCGTEITVKERIKLLAQKNVGHDKKIKSWDFCQRCYLSLCKGIEKGIIKKKGK